MKKLAYTKPETAIEEIEIESYLLADSNVETKNPEPGTESPQSKENDGFTNSSLWD